MDLNELRMLLDFGMVVILWLVQLVIYPSFLTCDLTKLVEWHRAYTRRVAWVIIPVMFTQLPLVGWLTREEPTRLNLAAFVCILIAWLLTFTVSVPLHRKIDSGDTSSETMQRLIKTNWPRTVLWTAAFVLGMG
ncbi:hypothetical protein DDZ13_04235 [Coraliomargarita sinensis]|uniref:Uncharacterized protein n=1 Tax=Coraliomargarita sinensis TaxID=2174842 RepID=A0A317ZHX9_9BACT|nr:DUF1772 domain-containing protein [Coraliomargarita sinensis]PXA05176.1 hypothetical protein DDZ13_04235 [Coraliomargarita sinensis]